MKTMILSTEWGEWVFFLPELAALEALYADRLGAGRNEKRMLTAGLQFRIPGK